MQVTRRELTNVLDAHRVPVRAAANQSAYARTCSAAESRHHLRRPVPGRGDLLTDDAENTVDEIDPVRVMRPGDL